MDDRESYLAELTTAFELVSKVPVKSRKVICDVINIQKEELSNRLRHGREEDADRLRDYLDWLDTLTIGILEADKVYKKMTVKLKTADRFKWFHPQRYLRKLKKEKTAEQVLQELQWGIS